MINPIGIVVLIVIAVVYYLVYRFSFSKISTKKFSLIGLVLSIIPLVYFVLLAILGQSLMPCNLIPSALAGMEPIFLRDLIGMLIGISPLLGLFSGIAIFKKEKGPAIAIIILSIISLIATSVMDVCIQF